MSVDVCKVAHSARAWQILERGHEISKRDWRLIRVAIVGLEGTVFLGCALIAASSVQLGAAGLGCTMPLARNHKLQKTSE